MKHKNLKKLIIPMIILTIATSVIISIHTNYQYKQLTVILNEKIAEIVGVLKQNYPQIDSRDIIKILNQNDKSDSFEIGKNELLQYGIKVDEINAIVDIEEQMNLNFKINILVILLFSLCWGIIIICYLRKRDKKINEITKYINDIRNRKYDLNIDENSEDELSNLKNELYKITIMLKEESEISKKDRENLKISVQDISHQLKTPLTSITIMLDNLQDNPKMNEKTKQKFIFEISKQIEWINWLVISILKLSKLDANVIEFKREKIYLKTFLDEIKSNLEIPIEIKNQNIIIEGNENDSFIGDYKWQQEAITNIVKNCIEHNIDGGTIKIHYEENNLFTKISIKDEGQGIAKEELRHIFERFYKGKNSSENSVGIGLSLAKNIIEKDNGLIVCKSELGNGTEFVIKYMK